MAKLKDQVITRKPSQEALKEKSIREGAPAPRIEHQADMDERPSHTSLSNTSAPASQSYKRTLTGAKKIFTDLFKLAVEKVIKYEGWEEDKDHPESNPSKFSHWEHTHPFRTYDKKGAKQNLCTPIGGHFHVVEWEDATAHDGTPIIKSVSGPKVMGKVRIKGRMVSAPVDANDYDTHTHEVEYLRSAEIMVTATNLEATKIMSDEAQKLAPVPGVTVKQFYVE